MERMDYFDRFFEPAAARSGPVVAMDPIANPGDMPPTAPTQDAQSAGVVAMEPIPNPASFPPGRDRTLQAGAAARAPEPRPLPAPTPDPDAEARTRSLVRQNPWLTQFWMELTPAQQQRVRRQLQAQRGNLQLAAGQAEPAAVWDPMGLADRARLIFGNNHPPERPAPLDRRDNPILARDS